MSLDALKSNIIGLLEDRIRPMFKSQDRIKLTLIVRDPTDDEKDVMVSDDQIPDLRTALDRHEKREPK